MHQTPSGINVPHSHVCTFNVKCEHKLSILCIQPSCQCHLKTAISSLPLYYHPSSVLANTFAATLHIHVHTFSRDVHLSAHTLTQFITTQRECSHQSYTPTNLTFNGHSLTILQTHACIYPVLSYTGAMLCVKLQDPDGSPLVRVSCDDFGQTTHTHTPAPTHVCTLRDGDPLSVASRWTC